MLVNLTLERVYIQYIYSSAVGVWTTQKRILKLDKTTGKSLSTTSEIVIIACNGEGATRSSCIACCSVCVLSILDLVEGPSFAYTQTKFFLKGLASFDM